MTFSPSKSVVSVSLQGTQRNTEHSNGLSLKISDCISAILKNGCVATLDVSVFVYECALFLGLGQIINMATCSDMLSCGTAFS